MGVVANGFGLIIGASDGWGGGVARCRSSLRMYVPSVMFSVRFNVQECAWSYLHQQPIDIRAPSDATGCYSFRSWASPGHLQQQDYRQPAKDIAEGVAEHCGNMNLISNVFHRR